MRKRSVGINVRVTVTEKKKVTMLARKCGLSLSEYLRQRALGYEPGGHPPTEVFDVLDKLDEIAEKLFCMREGAAISAHTDRIEGFAHWRSLRSGRSRTAYSASLTTQPTPTRPNTMPLPRHCTTQRTMPRPS